MAGTYASVPVPPSCRGLQRPAGSDIPVGVVGPHYNLERVSYLAPPAGYRYYTLKRLPLERLIYLGRGGGAGWRGAFWRNTPVVMNRALPLVHTWNMLPVAGARRFVVSFELELPRYFGRPRPWQQRLAMSVLESERCRACLALSDAALRLADHRLNEAGAATARAKLRIFRGAVAPSVQSAREWSTSGPLRILFVGGDGIRKGLLPLVAAARQAHGQGIEIELTVISAIARGKSYVFGELTPPDAPLRKELSETPWITHHERLPNDRVRALMRSHDLFVLPSFDESLGWVLIEAGMEGMAAVTSDVFAFPEIVEDEVTGKLLALPLDDERRWRGIAATGSQKREAIAQAETDLREGIVQTLARISACRELPANWGMAARRRMHEMYHPQVAAHSLKRIYDAALDRS